MRVLLRSYQLFWLLLLSVVANAAPSAGDLVATIMTPAGVRQESVHAAISKAARERQWNIVADSGSRVVLRLLHRGYEANLTFEYDARRISVYSDSYRVSRAGERREKAVPKGWIDNLAKSIRESLASAPMDGRQD